MAHKTGLRLLAALFALTGIGIPVALLLMRKASKEEQKIEERNEALRQMAE